jgi:hypothetical protein
MADKDKSRQHADRSLGGHTTRDSTIADSGYSAQMWAPVSRRTFCSRLSRPGRAASSASPMCPSCWPLLGSAVASSCRPPRVAMMPGANTSLLAGPTRSSWVWCRYCDSNAAVIKVRFISSMFTSRNVVWVIHNFGDGIRPGRLLSVAAPIVGSCPVRCSPRPVTR